MYGGFGGVSTIVHLAARRPVVAASVALVAITVAVVPKVPAAPSTPPTPVVVTVTPETHEPAIVPQKHETSNCTFGKTPTNLCKGTLDNVALFLKSDKSGYVIVHGDINHILAVRKYFTAGESKFGIEPTRVHLDANDSVGFDKVVIEQVP